MCLAHGLESNTRFIFKGGVEAAWDKAASCPITITHSTETTPIKIEDLKNNNDNQRIEKLQKILDTLGFNPGTIDNKIGPKTRSALLAFKKDFNKHLQQDLDKIAGERGCDAYNKLKEDGNIIDQATIDALEIYAIWQQTHTELEGLQTATERSRIQAELIGRNWREMMGKYPFKGTWKKNKRAEIFTSRGIGKENERFTGKDKQNERLYNYLASLPVEELAALLENNDIAQRLETQHTNRAETAVARSKEIVAESADKKLAEFMRILYSENGLYEVAQKAVDGEGNIQLAGWIEALSDFFRGRDKPEYTEAFIRNALEDRIDQTRFQTQRTNILNAMKSLGMKSEHNKPWFKELIGLAFFGFLTLGYLKTKILTSVEATANRNKASQFVNWITSTNALKVFDPKKEYGSNFTDTFEQSRKEHAELMARTGVVQRHGEKEHFTTQQETLKTSEERKRKIIDQFIDQYGKSGEIAADELYSWWEAYFEKEDGKDWTKLKKLWEVIKNEKATLDERVNAVKEAQGMLKAEQAEDKQDTETVMKNWGPEYLVGKYIAIPYTYKGWNQSKQQTETKTENVYASYEIDKDSGSGEFVYRWGRGQMANLAMVDRTKEPFKTFEESGWKKHVQEARNGNKDRLMQAPEAFHGYTTEFHRQIKELCNKIHQLDGSIDANRLAGVLDQFPTWKNVFVRYPAPDVVQTNLTTLFDTCSPQDIDSPQDIKNEDLEELLNAEGVQEWLTAVLSPETYDAYYRNNILRTARTDNLTTVDVENNYAHGRKVTNQTTYQDLISQSPDGQRSTAEYILGSIAESHADFPLYLTPAELEVAFKGKKPVAVDTLPDYVQNRSRQVRDGEQMKTLPAGDAEIWQMKHEKKYQIIGEDGVTRELTMTYDLYLRPDCANVVTVPGSLSLDSEIITLDPLNLPTAEYLQENFKIPGGIQVWGGSIGMLRGNKGTTGIKKDPHSGPRGGKNPPVVESELLPW